MSDNLSSAVSLTISAPLTMPEQDSHESRGFPHKNICCGRKLFLEHPVAVLQTARDEFAGDLQ